jgi:hypothetical protein
MKYRSSAVLPETTQALWGGPAIGGCPKLGYQGVMIDTFCTVCMLTWVRASFCCFAAGHLGWEWGIYPFFFVVFNTLVTDNSAAIRTDELPASSSMKLSEKCIPPSVLAPNGSLTPESGDDRWRGCLLNT